MKELLKIENISKIYQAKNGEIEALKDISFTVKQGEWVTAKYYVSESVYDATEIGAIFKYDKDRDWQEAPYTQEKQ